jgi:hypothetical protein
MITKEIAVSLRINQTLYYKEKIGSDKRPLRARVNGITQTWKRDPHRFRVPMKHGLSDTFSITERNACDWTTNEQEALLNATN